MKIIKGPDGETVSRVGKTVLEEASELSHKMKHCTRVCVSFSFLPTYPDTDFLSGPDFRMIDGTFHLIYEPFGGLTESMRYRVAWNNSTEFNWLKTQKEKRHYYKSYEHFVEMADKYEVENFLLRATNICERTFEIARQYVGLRIPFCLDIDKYTEACGGQAVLRSDELTQMCKNIYQMKRDLRLIGSEARRKKDEH